MNLKKSKAQSLVEYVMLLALVFLVAVPGYMAFGGEATKMFDNLKGTLETGFSSNSST